jgi:hypothetical protein
MAAQPALAQQASPQGAGEEKPTASPQEAQGPITLSAAPEQPCLDTRPTSYLNFDLVVQNGTDQELKVKQMRAFVLSPSNEAVERRIVWADALGLLAPDRTVAAKGQGVIYNPLTFNSIRPGYRVRYEIAFEGVENPAIVTVQPRSCAPHARLILPLPGRVNVLDGHDFLSHHRRFALQYRPEIKAFGMVDNPSRFALDLVQADANGAFFTGDGKTDEQWYGWKKPIRAPGAGQVAAVNDGVLDNDQVGKENRWVPKRPSEDEMMTYGNYVLIDHGGGEFSLMAHMHQGSVRVKKGDSVKPRDIVGEVGNSGSSLAPHVHYELRTGWGLRSVRALPAYFHDVKVVGTGEGQTPVQVNTGDVLIAR